ncbi:5-oxoprolinase subunit PxpB [Nitrogeniibacter mangrovi]|uniref:5-oxoprolinase subunit PxpB n=1 Tax=Nitrogeniibacter mangrovi TaxID=2016596 RepID=A0A6C1BB18_9RHOO|nr:5-oxoprolinase subunit PxpB [Nitrogeniibacter mangrovi]QID19600.1 5-oxoprolinase subunit PxpB [Nitrogeniibacter mangrovi]
MRILDLGDTAFTIEFGDTIDPALQAQVAALDAALAAAQAAGRLPGLIETVPTFRSLTLIYDPLQTRRATLEPLVRACLDSTAPAPAASGRRWRLPACYGGAHGPDLAAVAAHAGLTAEALVDRHTGTEYVVYMLGFLPGFPFMGDVAEALRRPRRDEPRVRVPAGSVALANGLTAIYPWESPGGWHLIGRCPAPLFDPSRAAPALLAAGDRVRFTPVDADTLADLEADLAHGRLDPADWQVGP